MKQTLKPGDLLTNRITGQTMAVIRDDGKTVSLMAMEPTVRYPSDRIWEHFKEVKKESTTGHST